MRSSLVLVVCLTGVGCAAPADPCALAADHVAACTGELTVPTAAATCDEVRADALLAMDCEELADAAAAGKADGWWDSFLCLIGFSSHCSDGSGSGSGSTVRTLTGNVHKVSDNSPAPGVYVRVSREGAPAERSGSWTHAGGLFAIQNLAPARYRLEVAVAPTAPALVTQTIDVATQSYVYILAPVP